MVEELVSSTVQMHREILEFMNEGMGFVIPVVSLVHITEFGEPAAHHIVVILYSC